MSGIFDTLFDVGSAVHREPQEITTGPREKRERNCTTSIQPAWLMRTVFKCFAEHGKSSPLVAGAPVEVQPDELQLSFQMQRQAAFDAVPLDPRSCPGPGVKLCTYRRWFSRPAHQVCPVYWEVPMSTAKLQKILRFRMGSHLLPIKQGRHLRLPRHRRVCRLCHTGALGDERHMLLECPALADLRDEYFPLVAECSRVMARLVWARNQPMVSRYIIACLDRMSC